MSEQGGTYLAGPPNSATSCLVCHALKPAIVRVTDGLEDNWHWLKPGPKEREIFAGFFCSDSCSSVWKELDDHGRLRLLFNDKRNGVDLSKGLQLLAEVEAGTYREATADEPQEVPIFGPRLTTLEASAWVELRGLWGKKINLARSAPHRLEGWREPVTTGSFTRFW